MSTLYDSPILIGPIGVGKSTVASLISSKLNLKHLNVDKYIRKNFVISEGPIIPGDVYNTDLVIMDTKAQEIIQITFLRHFLEKFKERLILDLPGTFGVFSNKKYFKEAISALESFKDKFLLLPSSQSEENLTILRDRLLCRKKYPKSLASKRLAFEEDVCNQYLLKSENYMNYGARIIYTKDKTPNDVTEEIITYMKK